MMRCYAGYDVVVDEHGHLTEPKEWNMKIARAIAGEEGITLEERHIRVIQYMRENYFAGHNISIRDVNRSGIVNLKELYTLFPGTPLKKAFRIGGLPYPESCV